MKHPLLAFKQNLVSKGQLALRSTWGMRWKTPHQKGCFYRTVVNRNLTQWLRWTERFMWITSVYHRVPQDDTCGLAFFSFFFVKPQFNCTRAFWPAQCLKRCLWKVFIRKEENGIWTVLITLSCHSCSRYKSASSPLAQASCCGSKYYGCKYGNTINTTWWHKDVLVFSYNLFK